MTARLLTSSRHHARQLCLLTLSALAVPPLFALNHADSLAGARLYHERGCLRCHGDSLEGTSKGPSLASLRKDHPWTQARIADQIVNGGQSMPPFGEALTPQEVQQLIVFLRARHKAQKPPAPPANHSAELPGQ